MRKQTGKRQVTLYASIQRRRSPVMYEIVKIAVEVAFVAVVAYAIYSAVKKKKK